MQGVYLAHDNALIFNRVASSFEGSLGTLVQNQINPVGIATLATFINLPYGAICLIPLIGNIVVAAKNITGWGAKGWALTSIIMSSIGGVIDLFSTVLCVAVMAQSGLGLGFAALAFVLPSTLVHVVNILLGVYNLGRVKKSAKNPKQLSFFPWMVPNHKGKDFTYGASVMFTF